jgi:EAL domain-containing protein (putative c-di-GMP-specific phosphodiesterase class I)
MLGKAMVALSRDLGYRVVAEVVETEETLAFLKSIGCDESEGYLFAKPRPPDTFVEWLWQRQASGSVRTHDSLLRIGLDSLPSALAAVGY